MTIIITFCDVFLLGTCQKFEFVLTKELVSLEQQIFPSEKVNIPILLYFIKSNESEAPATNIHAKVLRDLTTYKTHQLRSKFIIFHSQRIFKQKNQLNSISPQMFLRVSLVLSFAHFERLARKRRNQCARKFVPLRYMSELGN